MYFVFICFTQQYHICIFPLFSNVLLDDQILKGNFKNAFNMLSIFNCTLFIMFYYDFKRFYKEFKRISKNDLGGQPP